MTEAAYADPAAYPGGWATRTEATASSLNAEMIAMGLYPLRIMIVLKVTRSRLEICLRITIKR